MQDTNIEWAHHTFNPWQGCTKVSAGCKNCYAAARSARFKQDNWGAEKPRIPASENTWKQPLAWNEEARRTGVRKQVFSSSLADVMDDEAPEGARERLFSLIRETPYLDWLLLTKRPENFQKYLPWMQDGSAPYPNVWLGVTTEDKKSAAERIPILQQTPVANIRFLSAEPLLEELGDVDLRGIHWVIIGVKAAPMQDRCSLNGRRNC
jgi:protein gp37